MQRRTFLVGGAAATGAALGLGAMAYERKYGREELRRYGTTRVSRSRPASDAPDVLFISLDDCNDWLGFLNNHPGTYTPNLDALAAESLVFSNAYCTAPMCLPARTSVMFGVAPYETGVYDHTDASHRRYETVVRSRSSLVDDFWAAGYDVVGGGKVFGDAQRGRWTQFHPTPVDTQDPNWTSPFDGRPIGTRARAPIDFGPSGRSPEEEPDGQTGAWVRKQLVAPRNRPLFLAYGLISSHVSWRVPQRFFDLHPIESVVVPEIHPDDLDDIGPAGYSLVERRTLEALQERGLYEEAVQAYQAAISYADDRVGMVLDALASSPRGDQTIVALWSDHGFHLGEKLHWHKFTLWERATRIPMLFRVPGQFSTGQTFEPPVSALDIGPTLSDWSGVRVGDQRTARSLVPFLDQPALADERPPISTWLPGNHAVRRGPWRYIRYQTGEAELYDHRDDPDELVNLSGRSEYSSTERELAAFLPELASEVDPDRPLESAGSD
jgi:arylsulfatase A-like enzyme